LENRAGQDPLPYNLVGMGSQLLCHNGELFLPLLFDQAQEDAASMAFTNGVFSNSSLSVPT
jgi:hypothetical protein